METRIELPSSPRPCTRAAVVSAFFFLPPTNNKTNNSGAEGKKKWPDDSFVSTISTDQHQSSVSCPAIISMDRFQCLLPWLPTAPISNSITAITLNGRNDLKKKNPKGWTGGTTQEKCTFLQIYIWFRNFMILPLLSAGLAAVVIRRPRCRLQIYGARQYNRTEGFWGVT